MTKNNNRVSKLTDCCDVMMLVDDFLATKKMQGVTHDTIRSHKSALTIFFGKYTGDFRDFKKMQQAVALFLDDKKNEYYNKILQSLC